MDCTSWYSNSREFLFRHKLTLTSDLVLSDNENKRSKTHV